MRVLQVIPGLPGTNSMIFARRQSREIERHVGHLSIFDLEKRSPQQIPQSVKALKSVIEMQNITLLHAQFGSVTSLICGLAKLTSPRPIRRQLKLVTTFRGSDLNPDTTVSFFRNFMQKVFSHLGALTSDHVICVSDETRARLWWRRRNISVLPTGCDTDLFYPMPRGEARKAVSTFVSLPEGQPLVVLNAGKTPEFKGEPIIKEALALLRQNHGIESYLKVCRNDVPVDKMPALLNAADVVVLASLYEGSPTVLEETMACETSIVSTPAGDAKQRLRNVMGSFIAQERNAQSLCHALALALSYVGPRNSREIALQECAQGVIVAQILEIYRRLQPDALDIGVG